MLQIRAKTYRGKAGFTVSGMRPGQVGGWPARVFTTTRESAERIKARLKAGLDTRLEDFAPMMDANSRELER